MRPFQSKIQGSRIILLAVLAMSLTPTLAHAYLDPGTGSAMIQGLIAAIAAIGLTLKVYWHRVLAFLRLRRPSKLDEGSDSADQSEN